MLRLIMTALLCLIYQTANAAKAERVYFVRGADEPVVISAKPHAGQGIIMRDPNLGAKAEAPATKKAAPPKKVVEVKIAPKKSSALAFKPMRIGATLHMPRVEFGRVALPVDIREEQHSTDFIARSLEDLP